MLFSAVLKQGLEQPLFLNADLALACLLGKDDDKAFASNWQDSYNQRGYSYDSYIAQFWSVRWQMKNMIVNGVEGVRRCQMDASEPRNLCSRTRVKDNDS